MTGFRVVWACLFILSSLSFTAGQERAAESKSSEDSDAAISLFSTWIRQSPTVDNYINRGNCYLVRGEYEKAAVDFSAAHQIDPKNLRPLLYRAAAYRFMKEVDKALADLDLALQMDPTSIKALQDRGSTYLLKKDYAKSLADYSKIIEKYATNPIGYLLRAEAYIEMKDYDRAIADYSELLRQHPKEASLLKYRSTTYFSKKDYENAIRDMNELIGQYPNEPRALLQRSFIYFTKKDYQNALNDLGEALKLDPTNALLHRNVAAVYSTCPQDSFRNGQRALQFAIKACELSSWKNADCLSTLASSYAETGNFPNAIKWEKAAIEIGFKDKEQDQKHQLRLKLYQENKPFREE